MADIKVQRGVTDIGNTGGTDTTFTAVSALTAAFERNTNNQKNTAGDNGSTSNIEVDDISGRLELTATGTLTFTRIAGSKNADMRFAWELMEYIGAASGDNEFIVRSRNTVSMATAADGTATLDTTPTDIDACIPFITGISSTVTNNGEDHATAVAWIDDSGTLNVSRGGGDGSGTTVVQVVTVEFTGSNWEVYHGISTGQAGDTGTITLNTDSDGAGGTTGDVTSWATAMIFGTHRVSSNHEGLAHQAVRYLEGAGTTTVNWAFDGGHAATGDHVVHVLRHPDMAVTRFTSTGNATGAVNVDITSAGLTDLEQAIVEGYVQTSGTGDALGRGWRNYRFTSLTNVEAWCHRSGNTMQHQIQVADLTGVAGGTDAAPTTTTIAATATIAAAGTQTGASVTPATVAATTTTPTAVAQTSSNAAPTLTTIVAATTVPAAVTQTSSNTAATLTTIAATTVVSATGIQTGTTVTTTAVAVTSTVPLAATQTTGNAQTNPTAITVAATIPTAVAATGSNAAPTLTAIAATVTVGDPTVLYIPNYLGNNDVGLISDVGDLTDHSGGTFDTGTTTLTQRRITGRIDVRDGANLILRDCLFDMSNASSFVFTQWDDTNPASGYVLIEDCTFGTGTNDQGDHISIETTATSVPNEPARYNGYGAIIRRTVFQRGRDAMQGGKNLYIEQVRTVAADAITTPDYGDGFQSLGGSHIKFSYCNLHVEPVPEGYAGIILKTDLTDIDDVVIDNCRINGGAFNLDFDGDTGNGDVTNVVVTNNVLTNADSGVTNNVDGIATWSNNVDGSGTPIPQPGPGTTANPTTIAATTTIPAGTVQAGATVNATAIAAVTTVPSVTVDTAGNTQTNPIAIAATVTVPGGAIQTGSTATLTTVAATATVPATATAGGIQTNPTAIAATAAMPSVSTQTAGNTAVSITAITATVTTPTTGIQAQASVTTTAIAITVVVLSTARIAIVARGWRPPSTIHGWTEPEHETLPAADKIGTLSP